MKRWTPDEFLAEVLKGLPDVPTELKEGLLRVVQRPATARAREFQRVFEEHSRG